MTRSAFTFALLILSSTSVAAETKEPAPPQLYVRADVEYPEKGYIEKRTTTPGDANVSFRRCNDLQPIVVPKNSEVSATPCMRARPSAGRARGGAET